MCLIFPRAVVRFNKSFYTVQKKREIGVPHYTLFASYVTIDSHAFIDAGEGASDTTVIR